MSAGHTRRSADGPGFSPDRTGAQIPNWLALQIVALALIALLSATPARTAPVYPLKNSANGRYLVDQNNAPFLLIGDTAWNLVVNISEAEAALYFANRQAAGFNAVMMDLLCGAYTEARADSSTYDGILPFTAHITPASYNLAAPNETYFAHVDRILNLAASYGLTVFLGPLDTGSYYRPEGSPTMQDNGVQGCRAFGQYLGDRYKNFPNIVWQHGGDYSDEFWEDGDPYVTAVALGIKDSDPNHIHTIELISTTGSLDNPNWIPIVKLNGAYTWRPTYTQVLTEYNRVDVLPVFVIEDHYEDEILGSPPENVELGTPLVNRRQSYWTMTCGATGKHFGNRYIWRFHSGWQSHLNTRCVVELGYMKTLFEARRWYDLVPDQTHLVMTAGYGTFTWAGKVSESDYATAARTLDGSLVVAYLPTIRTVTIAMASLSGPVTARWYDPTNGTYTSIGTALRNFGERSFTPPGANSAGDGDWILLLETQPPPGLSLTAPAQSAAQIAQDGFRLTLSGDLPGLRLIEATDDLSNWQLIETINYTGGQVEMVDSNARGLPRRFYRARSEPIPVGVTLGGNFRLSEGGTATSVLIPSSHKDGAALDRRRYLRSRGEKSGAPAFIIRAGEK